MGDNMDVSEAVRRIAIFGDIRAGVDGIAIRATRHAHERDEDPMHETVMVQLRERATAFTNHFSDRR